MILGYLDKKGFIVTPELERTSNKLFQSDLTSILLSSEEHIIHTDEKAPFHLAKPWRSVGFDLLIDETVGDGRLIITNKRIIYTREIVPLKEAWRDAQLFTMHVAVGIYRRAKEAAEQNLITLCQINTSEIIKVERLNKSKEVVDIFLLDQNNSEYRCTIWKGWNKLQETMNDRLKTIDRKGLIAKHDVLWYKDPKTIETSN